MDRKFVLENYSRAKARRNQPKSSDRWSILVYDYVLGDGSIEEEAWKNAADRINAKDSFLPNPEGVKLAKRFQK